MQRQTILIADSDAVLRRNLKKQLLVRGYESTEAFNPAGVWEVIRTRGPDLVILGAVANNEWKALEVAQEIHQCRQGILLILIVENGSEELAIAALRSGINDYFRKPLAMGDLLRSINCLLKEKRCCAHPVNTRTSARNLTDRERLIGASPPIEAIKSCIANVASTDSTVLLTGETGTGKELVTELIHENSLRSDKPLVCVNSAAMPDNLLESELFGFERGAFTGAFAKQRGKFEMATGGTLFLDEIAEMSLHAQAKILRVLESNEIYRLGGHRPIDPNVRIIAATNQDPEKLISTKRFRKDLYYRLNVARIHLPPLRERQEDIPLLLEHYIKQFNRNFGRSVERFTEEVLACLLRYDWPGNVRELKNLCEAVFVNLPSRRIAFVNLPELYQKRLREIQGLPRTEREHLLSALFSTNWNVSRAARKLRWSRMTIYRKIKKYDIAKPE